MKAVEIKSRPSYSDMSTGVSRGEEGSVYATDHHSARRRNENADRDLWFKAAVIAVPIAGGFILVLLVLLAVRMLRSDSTRHRRLIQIRRERSLTKAQMYISEHFMGGTSSSSGMKNKLHHCSLFDGKLCPPRESYSVYSEKAPQSSGSSSRGGNSCVSGVSSGCRENSSKVLTSSGNIIYKGDINSSGGVSVKSFSPAMCCTDELPCCGGLCSISRETQIRQCETCNSKRRSRTACNCNRCSSILCHTDCAVSPSNPDPTSDIKSSNSCSSSSEGLSNVIAPINLSNLSANHGLSLVESNNVHQTPRSFFPDLHTNHDAGFVSKTRNSTNSDIPSPHNPSQIRCDHSVKTSLAHLQQHPQPQQQLQLSPSQSQQLKPHQYLTIVAHWDKTNLRAPTAVV
ncbi:BMP and activin membrane-bound inhibitor-like protein [Elysia marginata]|uniref:BMP and activin membrane-bound inhibitor-like protein n=1 Tax=Elysia marginata TaxID=1093978 RepID=A0AAV4G384_9GAST|nr:BMP and activin membrane-bound inhibitor-like protein [Elysia marginata]